MNNHFEHNRIEVPNSTQRKFNYLLMLPIIIVSAIIPLIIHEYAYHPKLNQFSWFPNMTDASDIFMYYKQAFLVGIAAIMFFILLCKLCFDRKSMKLIPLLLPLGIYAGMSILSSMVSKYASYTVSGIYEQFEGVFALISYCMIVLYAFWMIKYESDLKLIVSALIASMLILSVLGVTQLASHDLLRNTAFMKLYLNKDTMAHPELLNFGFEANRVYLTLNNPNYVGVYSAMMIPFLICLIYFSKKVWKTAIYIIALAGMGICLIGSKSKASLIAIAVALIFLLIFLRKELLKKWYITAVGVLGIVAVVLALVLPASPLYSAGLAQLMKKSEVKENHLDSVEVNPDNVTIVYNGNPLQIQMILNNDEFVGFNFFDESGQPLTDVVVNEEQTGYLIQDPRFLNIEVTPRQIDKEWLFEVAMEKGSWYFSNTLQKGKYVYINPNLKEDNIVAAKSALFTNHESFATGRGYIWSRTIPLLSRYFILGAGADTYAFEFPQNDYVGMYNNGFYGQMLTKPHSMYLQIWTQTGMISLIAFIALYLMYFVSCIRIYFKNKFETYSSCVGVAIFIATTSYMITAITNDSIVCVAPVFWTLLGVGITINFKFYRKVEK